MGAAAGRKRKGPGVRRRDLFAFRIQRGWLCFWRVASLGPAGEDPAGGALRAGNPTAPTLPSNGEGAARMGPAGHHLLRWESVELGDSRARTPRLGGTVQGLGDADPPTWVSQDSHGKFRGDVVGLRERREKSGQATRGRWKRKGHSWGADMSPQLVAAFRIFLYIFSPGKKYSCFVSCGPSPCRCQSVCSSVCVAVCSSPSDSELTEFRSEARAQGHLCWE